MQTTTTFTNETDGTRLLTSNDDLAFAKTSNTQTGKVEVRIASKNN